MAYGPCVMFLGRPGIGKYLGCDKNMSSFSKANISPSLAEAGKFSGEVAPGPGQGKSWLPLP